MSIAVVVPTTGRDTLTRAVASARDADEVLVYENRDGSPSAAINRAIAETTCEWLVVVADDDFLLPGAITRMRAHLAGDIIFSDLYLADDTGAVTGLWSYADRPTTPQGLLAYLRDRRMNPIPLLGPWRVAWLRDSGARFLTWQTTGYADDCRTFLDWAQRDPDIRYVPGPFHVYTMHAGQMSRDGEERAKYLTELDAFLKGD